MSCIDSLIIHALISALTDSCTMLEWGGRWLHLSPLSYSTHSALPQVDPVYTQLITPCYEGTCLNISATRFCSSWSDHLECIKCYNTQASNQNSSTLPEMLENLLVSRWKQLQWEQSWLLVPKRHYINECYMISTLHK